MKMLLLAFIFVCFFVHKADGGEHPTVMPLEPQEIIRQYDPQKIQQKAEELITKSETEKQKELEKLSRERMEAEEEYQKRLAGQSYEQKASSLRSDLQKFQEERPIEPAEQIQHARVEQELKEIKTLSEFIKEAQKLELGLSQESTKRWFSDLARRQSIDTLLQEQLSIITRFTNNKIYGDVIQDLFDRQNKAMTKLQALIKQMNGPISEKVRTDIDSVVADLVQIRKEFLDQGWREQASRINDLLKSMDVTEEKQKELLVSTMPAGKKGTVTAVPVRGARVVNPCAASFVNAIGNSVARALARQIITKTKMSRELLSAGNQEQFHKTVKTLTESIDTAQTFQLPESDARIMSGCIAESIGSIISSMNVYANPELSGRKLTDNERRTLDKQRAELERRFHKAKQLEEDLRRLLQGNFTYYEFGY